MAALFKFVQKCAISNVCGAITHIGTVRTTSKLAFCISITRCVSFFCKKNLSQTFPDFYFFSPLHYIDPLNSVNFRYKWVTVFSIKIVHSKHALTSVCNETAYNRVNMYAELPCRILYILDTILVIT